MERVIKGLNGVAKRINKKVALNQVKEYVKMLDDEHKDAAQLNPISRVRMLIAIHDAFASGRTLADLGIQQASELEHIITKVETRTNNDLNGKQEAFVKIGMDEDALFMFFRKFIHDLADMDGRERTNRIRAKEEEPAQAL